MLITFCLRQNTSKLILYLSKFNMFSSVYTSKKLTDSQNKPGK